KDFGAVYYFCRLSAEKAETVDTDVICVDITTALSSFEYTVDAQAGTVLLSKYIGTEKTVVVPPFYTVDGTVYKTVLDSTTVFYQNTNITDVKLYEGVSFANNTMANLFHGCLYLVNADLSGVNTTGVTDMSHVFRSCTKLTAVDMTGIDTSLVTTMYCLFYDCKSLNSLVGYEDWDTRSLQNISGSFNAVSPLKIIDLSHWDLSKIESSRICFQNCKAEQILLPDNLKTINAFFMNHAVNVKGTTFTIPAGVEKIGYAHTFYDFATDAFTEFIIAEGNKNFKAIDGILYSADGKEMLAVPRGKTFENNTYVVPEGVEFFAELSFSRNYNIHTLLLPNSYEIVQYVPLRDPRYTISGDSGNINNGSNLNIATYRYTGITDYAVKDDNPRYESVDGIIYSEDMTTVLAVPRRYNRLINIPEGVTTIAFDALRGDGGMSNCTGINIPSTLTKISSVVYSALNTLRANYPKTFTITVNPDNPAYSVDANGALVVVSPFIEIYQQPEDLLPALGEQAILSVGAAVSNDTAPSYQWYSCVDENKTNATPIAGATEATFSAPTKDFGTVYY
ncbi:MAG: BspA family leucine-rich repeat surface protein, partial [Oscillospiraceae bacterium]|nr:BspA family leucine-rich repeat surface protein [Oscillospiraceae bacterium]